MSDKQHPDPSRALDRLIDARRQAPASGPGDAHDEIELLADMATALDALWPTLELRIAQTPQRRFPPWPSLRLPRITQRQWATAAAALVVVTVTWSPPSFSSAPARIRHPPSCPPWRTSLI